MAEINNLGELLPISENNGKKPLTHVTYILFLKVNKNLLIG